MKRRISQIIIVFALLLGAVSVSAQSTGQIYHTVAPGETLRIIAERYKVTTAAIAQANNLANINLIYAGQILLIPAAGQPIPPVVTPPSSQRAHVVQRGDRLANIAAWYGVSVQAIAAANSISNPNLIYPGQVLVIPREPVIYTHVVQPGQYVSLIARLYGSTTQAVVTYNRLAHPNVVYPGQVLYVPVYV